MPDAARGRAAPGAVWFREPRPAGRTSALTRERIVAAAVALLDEHGAAGLSMRKLAEVLNVHATSLYWHVPHRDDLLDLALDAVFADVALPARHSAEWREDVAAFMDQLGAALLRHPWSGPLASSRPLLGPNALARSEFVFAALVGAGFRGGRPDGRCRGCLQLRDRHRFGRGAVEGSVPRGRGGGAQRSHQPPAGRCRDPPHSRRAHAPASRRLGRALPARPGLPAGRPRGGPSPLLTPPASSGRRSCCRCRLVWPLMISPPPHRR